MKHATQVRLLHEVFAAIDAGRPPLTAASTRNDPAVYTSPDRQALEERTLFRRFPIVAGFSARVREPGDYFTDEAGPVPTLVVRGDDGRLRAFANACRHRGAMVARGAGHATRGFTCPYHAWCYDLRGRLEEVPDAFGFDDLEGHDLVELPVDEAYGLVWVHPTPGATIDVRSYLGELGADLDAYGSASMAVQGTRTVRRRMNWKMASDTFWEAYHLRILHRATLGTLYVRNLGHFEAFGPHHRFVGIRQSVEKLRGKPEAEWNLVEHATILNNIFPNTIYIMQKDHVEVFRVFPVWGSTHECITELTVLVDERGDAWEDVLDLGVGVITEDYDVSEGVQRNFEAGLLPHVNYGRYESAVEHFHASVRAALAEAGGG